ncbi:MAG: EAL domain-containing protein [Lachnospiraceae bacterium]|nr:EAL domain-containing protein [Lachnospiraceae bacterium]
MRKRIGVIMAQPEETTQNLFITSFMQEAYAKNYDICIFSMYQKYQETRLRNIGDSNIFSLIRYDCFDGFIVLLDTLQIAGLEQKIIGSLKENFKGPVIVVDKESAEYSYILMDHYTPMLELINHLIEFHEYKDIAFLGGKEGHPHSLQRYNAYLDAMKSHSLPVKESRIYHGNYWYNSGREFAEILLRSEDGLPEAVACGNDYMAIGLAARFAEEGIRIPEDVAVIGYDATEEGRTAPVPLTSAKVPAAECGKKCFYKLHHEITGEKMPVLPLKSEIILGGSCGCNEYKLAYHKINRDEWQNDHSTVSYYSDFNHLTEDMLCQVDYKKFFNVLAEYAHQIRPFKHFRLCLNDDFLNPTSFIGENARRRGYSDKMNLVVKCDCEGGRKLVNSIEFDRSFDTSLMLPELFEEREYPTTFIFTPLFFEDICFGYVVLNQERSLYIYNETYRVWIRNINLGIEAFYRQKALYSLIKQIKSAQVRDSQTGLYNYQGFYEKIMDLAEDNLSTSKTLGIIACDVGDLKGINEKYGRVGGDMAIRALAIQVLRAAGDTMEVCGRLSNDEFLIGFVSDDADSRYNEISEKHFNKGISFKDAAGSKQQAKVHHEMVKAGLGELPDIDFLINRAVNAKNHKKMVTSKNIEISDELLEKCPIVNEILDKALLKYAFQPIVRATDGEIYGYEALMRCKGDYKLMPCEIIKCAENLNRLYDVEKLTFNLVLDEYDRKAEYFGDAKVFINSLPAYQLHGEDKVAMANRFDKMRGKIVVEYTEGSEFSDEDLMKKREDYAVLNVEIALDDYGSGYSNVNNLIRYTPRYVKIDRMLIDGINANEQKRHFVKSIIGYAKKYDILVLAEGVETKEEMMTVISIGVDLIQGFYTAKPSEVPVRQIDEEIKEQIRRSSFRRENSTI